MDFSRDDEFLVGGFTTISTNKPIPSRVSFDSDDEEKYAADIYLSLDSDDEFAGLLHFRLYNDVSSQVVFEGKEVLEVILPFKQPDDSREDFFEFSTKNVQIIFQDGTEGNTETPTPLIGMNLRMACKLFFIDIIKKMLFCGCDTQTL